MAKYINIYGDDLIKYTEGMDAKEVANFIKQNNINPYLLPYLNDHTGEKKSRQVAGGDDDKGNMSYKHERYREGVDPRWSEAANILGISTKTDEQNAADYNNSKGYMSGDRGERDAYWYSRNTDGMYMSLEHQKHNEGKKNHLFKAGFKKLGDWAPTLVKAGSMALLGAGASAALGAAGASSAAGTAGMNATRLGEAELAAGLGFHGSAAGGLASGVWNSGVTSAIDNINPPEGLLDKAKGTGGKLLSKTTDKLVKTAIPFAIKSVMPKPDMPKVDPLVAEATNHYASVLPEFTKYSLGSGYDRNTPSTKGLVNV